ncbi:MAG: hypothetical protein KC613_05775, partial [Myxococcales bacterium]|nr:hypothetical protein [Myxococcales bacterium]
MTAPRLRTLAFLALAAAPAHADFVASTGQMDLSDATMAFGFEAADLAITVWDRGLLPIDPATSTVTGEALEGARALELGGALSHATLALGEALAPLAARRIALRLWVQPRGVDLVAAVEWHSHASPLTPSAHAIHLAPTGRVTSDGWRELSTGPFDAAFMGALPDRLLVTDGTLGAGTDLEPVTLFSPAPTLRARLDAVGVYDLGPALVPTVACTALDESPCGPDGRCLAGRCVDGAVVGGRPPLRHADRVATLARR